MKRWRSSSCSSRVAALARRSRAPRASARQLHDQPLQRARRRPATGSTSSTCSTWPRSRPSRRGRVAAEGDGATRPATPGRIAANLAPDRRRPAAQARPDPQRARRSRRARAAFDTTRLEVAVPWARSSRDRPRSPTATATTPAGSAGRRSSCSPSAGARLTRSSAPAKRQRASCSPTRRTCCRARSTSSRPRAAVVPGIVRRRTARPAARARCSSSAPASARSPTPASRG